METSTSIPNQLKNSIQDFLSNGTSLNLVLTLGVFLQIVIVMVLIKGSFRDNHVNRLGWIKSISYAILFVIGTPLISQISSAVLVFVMPFLLKYLDVMTLLGGISSISQEVAALSRPWAYALALLATAGFLIWRIRTNKRRSFTWVHAGQLVLFALFANIFFQFFVYGALVLFIKN